MTHSPRPCTVFHGSRQNAAGELSEMAPVARQAHSTGVHGLVLVFDDQTGAQIDLDLLNPNAPLPEQSPPPPTELAANEDTAAPPPTGPRGPGRPKLGVVAREVTLLPRHWEWLASQPGGASVALRKLVEVARKQRAGHDAVRRSQEATYRFISALAGNEAGFEEATRALFAGDTNKFAQLVAEWPADVRDYALSLAAPKES
jgi:uncharacterized protein